MKNKYCKIYLVRHAQSINNAKHEAGQQIFKKRHKLGSVLTTLGINQAKKLSKNFKRIQFDFSYSSDYNRAYKTAIILAEPHKIKVHKYKQIRERTWGNLEGKITKRVREKIKKLQKGLTDEEKMKIRINESVETDYEAMERLLKFLKKISNKHIGKTILVVGHGNTMRALLVHLGFANYDQLPSGSLKNTGYVVLNSDGKKFTIEKTYGIKRSKSS